jgi:hypothetical protein
MLQPLGVEFAEEGLCAKPASASIETGIRAQFLIVPESYLTRVT